MSSVEVAAIRKHAREYGHVSHIVSLEWLRQCMAARKAVPVDDSLALSLANLNAMLMESQRAAREAEQAEAAAASKLRVRSTGFVSLQAKRGRGVLGFKLGGGGV